MECAIRAVRSITVENAFKYSGVIAGLEINQVGSKTTAVLALKNLIPVYDSLPIKDPLSFNIYIRHYPEEIILNSAQRDQREMKIGFDKEKRKKQKLEELKQFLDSSEFPLYKIRILPSPRDKKSKFAIHKVKHMLEDSDTNYSFVNAESPRSPADYQFANLELYAFKSADPKKGIWVKIDIRPTSPESVKEDEIASLSDSIDKKSQLPSRSS